MNARSLIRKLCFGLFLLSSLALNADAQQSGNGGKLIPVKFQTDWYPQPEHGGFYTALIKGYYKDAGLDVTILPGGPNIVGGQLLAAGRVDFAMSSSDGVLIANATGIGLVSVGATMQHDPQGIMLHPEDPANVFADLEGRAVAIAPPGAAWFQYLVKKFDFKKVREIPATYTIANFMHDPKYIQQIFVTSEPFFVQKAGGKSKILLISDTGYDVYRVFCTTQKYLKENPEVVRKFVAASVHGWKDYIQDPAAANAEIAKRNPEMDKDRMIFSWQALKDGKFIFGADPSGAEAGKFDPARWAATYKILRGLNVITTDLDVTKSYTTEFVD
jgi:NitT/TauT family transport system substrate-binding protein